MAAPSRRTPEDLQLRGLAPRTQLCTLDAVKHLAHHYRRAPDPRSEEELRQYCRSLLTDKQGGEGTRRLHLDGIRLLYARPLQRPWPVFALTRPRHRHKLPVVSGQGVRHVLGLGHHRRAHTWLRLIHACGVR